MGLNFKEVDVLGNIINDTFGYGSTNHGEGGQRYTASGQGTPSSVSTKSVLHGDVLTITSLAVVNLGPIGTQHQEIAKIEKRN